jgi:hypothetical protein
VRFSNSIALEAEGQINSDGGPQSDAISSWSRISKMAIIFVPDHPDPERQSFLPVIDLKQCRFLALSDISL